MDIAVRQARILERHHYSQSNRELRSQLKSSEEERNVIQSKLDRAVLDHEAALKSEKKAGKKAGEDLASTKKKRGKERIREHGRACQRKLDSMKVSVIHSIRYHFLFDCANTEIPF